MATDNNLVSIGKGLYLGKPVEGSTGSLPEESQPSVIIICGWMGAKLPHLAKYSKVYDELYPFATKIVITSEPSFFWKNEKAKRAALSPVVDVLEALGLLDAPQGQTPSKPAHRILIHAFSNGGAWQLSTLGSVLNERMKAVSFSSTALPPSAVILDSCPGEGGVRRTQKAFLLAVRHPILKFVAGLVITCMIYFAYTVQWLFRWEPPLITMRKALIKPNLLPWLGKDTPRLYLYSDGDELILDKEVEAHAGLAKEAGLEVRLLKFQGSSHVAHARQYPEEYWGAVKQLWSDVLGRSRGD